MKRVPLLFLVLALGCKDKEKTPPPAVKPEAVEQPAAKPTYNWITYTSKDSKYTIEIPSAPKEEGRLVMSEFGATAADSRTSGCGIAVSKVPNKTITPKTMFDAMVKGYARDATVIEDKDIMLGTNPGRSLIIQNARHHKWIRLYVVGDELVINNCGAPFDRAGADEPIARRVLDSFKPI